MAFSNILKFKISLVRYLLVIRWILTDGLLKYKCRVTAAILAGSLSGFLQAVAVGQAIYYAKILEKGDVVSVRGYSLDPRSSILLLAAVAFGVIVSLVLSSFLEFFSRIQAIRITALYEVFCSRRMLESVAASQVLHNPNKNSVFLEEREIRRICHADSRLAGRTLRLLLLAVAPFTQLIIYSVMILYIDYIATLAVLVGTVSASFFLLRINQSATSGSRVYEESAPKAAAEKSQILNQLCTITQFNCNSEWINTMLDSGQIKVNRDAYENRLSVVERSRFVAGTLTAIIIGVIILYFGSKSLLWGASWGALLAYIFILRRSMTLIQQLSTLITSVNSFYPQVKRYHEFITFSGTELQTDPPGHDLSPLYARPLSGAIIPESDETCLFEQGHRYLLFSPLAPNRCSLVHIFNRLFPEDTVEQVLTNTCFVARNNAMPAVSLRRFLHLNDTATRADLLQEIKQFGIQEKQLEGFPADLDASLSPEQWNGLGNVLRNIISLEAVCRSRYPWVLIHEHLFSLLKSTLRDSYLQRLSDRTLLIVCLWDFDFGNLRFYNPRRVAVLSDRGLAGIGTVQWALSHQDDIVAACSVYRREFAASGGEEEDLIFLEE